jgi:hypothetical protein
LGFHFGETNTARETEIFQRFDFLSAAHSDFEPKKAAGIILSRESSCIEQQKRTPVSWKFGGMDAVGILVPWQ